MKKCFAVFLIALMAAVFAFSANIELAVDRYKKLVEDFNQGKSLFKEDSDLLSLSREYRIAIMGGMKDDAFFYDAQKWMELFFSKFSNGNYYDDISLASFLGYYYSQLNQKTLSVESLNNFAPFYKTYNGFVSKVKDEGTNYFSQWIGYGTGIIKEKPDDYFLISPPQTTPKVRFKLTYENNPEYFDVLKDYFSDEIIQLRLTEAIKKVSEDIAARKSETEIQKQIKRNAVYVTSPVSDKLIAEQFKTAERFVSNTPETFNILILRFFVYLGVFIYFFKKTKVRNFIYSGVFLFEFFFLIFSNNLIKSDLESLIYGVATIMGFAFSIVLTVSRVLNKKQRDLKSLSSVFMTLAVISLFLFPSFISPENLKMEKYVKFDGTKYYDVLEEELTGWTKGFLVSPFTDFRNNPQDVSGAINRISSNFSKAISFSDDYLRTGITDYLNLRLSEPLNSPLRQGVMEKVEKALLKPSISPSVYMFQTEKGLVILIFITLISCYLIIKRPGKNGYLFGMIFLIAAELYFIIPKTILLLVEKGYPIISVSISSPNIFLLVCFIVLLFLSLFLNFKKTVRR